MVDAAGGSEHGCGHYHGQMGQQVRPCSQVVALGMMLCGLGFALKASFFVPGFAPGCYSLGYLLAEAHAASVSADCDKIAWINNTAFVLFAWLICVHDQLGSG